MKAVRTPVKHLTVFYSLKKKSSTESLFLWFIQMCHIYEPMRITNTLKMAMLTLLCKAGVMRTMLTILVWCVRMLTFGN